MDPAIAKFYRIQDPFPMRWSDPIDEVQTTQRKGKRKTTTRFSVLQEEGLSSRIGSTAFETGVPQDEADPLGSGSTVIRTLKQKGINADENLLLRSRYLTSSKNFAPNIFLRDVHQDDTQESLLRGLDFLSRSIDQKSESLKVLVENNFDKFVAAKATIENVYKELKNRNLKKEEEWGVAPIRKPLNESSRKVQEIYGPILEDRGKEERYRALLVLLEKHRNILEIPSLLTESIKRRDYDAIVEEYQRARKWVEESRNLVPYDTVIPIESHIHQLIIAEKMWSQVEDTIENFKKDTWRKLVATKQDDNFMELIGILLELGVKDNPIWVWLLSRYDYLKNKITSSFERARIQIEVARRKAGNLPPPSEAVIAFYLKTPLRRIPTEKQPPLDTPAVVELWELQYELLNAILSPSNGIVAEIVSFWETAENFIQGKAQATLPVGIDDNSRKHHRLSSDGIRDLQKGGQELVTLLRDCMATFFHEPPVDDLSSQYSPLPPRTPNSGAATPATGQFPSSPMTLGIPKPKPGLAGEEYAFLPPNANSLGGVYYLTKIMTLLGNAGSTLGNLAIGQPGLERMKMVISGARERAVQAVCLCWHLDVQNCKLLEDWTRAGEQRDMTKMPENFLGIQSAVLGGMQKLVYLSEVKPLQDGEIIQPPSVKLLQHVRSQFVRSLYKALQGMVENSKRPLHRSDWAEESLDLASPVTHISATRLTAHTIDYTSPQIRLLLTLSNLSHLRSKIIPELLHLFEASFSVKLTEESKTITDALRQIDKQLFEEYTRPITTRLHSIVNAGIISSTWGATDKPTDASPYIYTSLLLLVTVHAQVSTSAPSLTTTIVSHLAEVLSRELRDTLAKIPKFNLGKLLQATLDTEFMAQTLGGYVTRECNDIQSAIYVGLDGKSDAAARQGLQAELGGLKSVLGELKGRSRSEFRCFRKKSAVTSGSSG
ncbi:hypothetical protein BJ508DRAFT_234861 [Ascobolus immersus RN42]|uniref:Exocyst complex component SEC5 n=1 Tax=Ascobolus immersus RN42 TaxID=1160509 RepID=A0A3N4IKL0_ASCIM|nr:hypothetical protein BJ508DRAFT_234861 [Ascobolus immersus RN42]